MRIVFWNIRAGGGRRAEWIASQLARWRPDIVGLCEYRATPPSVALARELAAQGLVHQRRAVCARRPSLNGVFLASRLRLRQVRLGADPPEPLRWLLARAEGGLAVGVFHAPNYVTGRKRPFLDAITDVASRWRAGPALFGGDSNTGVPPLDGNPNAFHPWECAWIPALERCGWHDAFRHLHGRRRAHTWFSPNAGTGYRLDQCFAHRTLVPRLVRVRHAWGRDRRAPARRDALSDHAAVIVDLELTPGARDGT